MAQVKVKEKAEDKKRLISHAAKSKNSKSTSAKGDRRRNRPPVDPARLKRIQKNRKYQNSAAGGLSITLQIPALSRAKKPSLTVIRGKLLARPLLYLPLGMALLLVGFLFVPRNAASDTVVPTAGAVKTQADFKVLTPATEQASAQKYDAKRDLVTYTTTFSGVRLTVSQQALPANFDKDPAAILKTADSIRAKQMIETVRGPLYIATNDEAGDQLAVYASKDLLVLIHTDRKLDDESWKSFVEQLESKS